MKRYLANYTIYKSEVYRQHVWSFDGETVTSEPFDIETPNTVFLDGVLVIGNEKLLCGEHIEEIKHLIAPDIKGTMARVVQYMQATKLTLEGKERLGAVEVNCVTKEVAEVKI